MASSDKKTDLHLTGSIWSIVLKNLAWIKRLSFGIEPLVHLQFGVASSNLLCKATRISIDERIRLEVGQITNVTLTFSTGKMVAWFLELRIIPVSRISPNRLPTSPSNSVGMSSLSSNPWEKESADLLLTRRWRKISEKYSLRGALRAAYFGPAR